MKFLLLALAALAGAVGLGQLIAAHPGVVAISVDGTSLRLSLSLFVVVSVVGALLLSWLLRQTWRLLTIRSRFRRWRQARARRLAGERLESGLLALVAGDYPRAERLLGRGGERSTLQYLAAAQAAHAQQASGRRDALLALAAGDTKESALALGIRRTEMLLDDGDWVAADAALAPLLVRHGEQAQVLLLRQRLLTLQGRFADLQSLLPLLRKRKVHPPARLDELETELAVRRLEAVATGPADLARVWSGLARRLRENPAIVAVYARALLKAGSQAGAEEVLRKALSTQWHARLIGLYGELDGNEVRGALTRAERWLEQHQEDPALLLSLGRLCLSQQLWGKARAYLETLSRLAPSPLVWRLLADACDELGDTRLAQQYRQRGLEHATAAALGREPPLLQLGGVLD